MKKIFLLCVVALCFTQSRSQNASVAIGTWREHISYNKAIDVTEDNTGLIYCASQFGVFTYSKNTGELSILSRLRELSDLEVSSIRFDDQTGILLIAYRNSNVDLIYPDKSIVNLPDIKQKSIIGGKNINSILILNGIAYLSTEFGIVLVDLDRKEIKDTYYIGTQGRNVNVNALAYDGTFFLAATDSGVYKANASDPNIFNFNAWNKDLTLTQPNASYTSAASFDGKFYVVKTNNAINQDTVMVFENNAWRVLFNDATEGALIDCYKNKLIYKNINKIASIDANGNELRTINLPDYGYPNFRKGFIDDEDNFWIADNNNGLVRQRSDRSIEVLTPNGPRSEAGWAMESKNGKLWVATGAMSGDSPNYEAKNGVYYFTDNKWNTYDCTNDTVYGYLCAHGSPAVVSVAVDPNDADHAFIGSWGNGLLEYHNYGGVKRYDESNSALHSVTLYPGYILVGGITFDPDGNLWAVAGGNTQGISVLTAGGRWQAFSIPDVSVANFGLYNLTVDDEGQKWFIAHSGASTGEGLCVFKEVSLDNPLGGSFARLTDRDGNGALPDLYVRAITKDKDGALWIGTNKGVAVIYNPGNVFSGQNYDAQKIIIQQDGYNQYLLETEIVTSVVVDGANRKWFGTYSGGVFLMSPDGTKQLSHFNTENSPIPSNAVLSMSMDDVTGELFIATDKGIVSYRSDATEGGEACGNYLVFPNPVRHEYTGPIAVRGLVENADVKITDVAGNIIYHTRANGGEAIWNGNNYRGERAQTGVYIVYVTNEDGTQTCETKMLFGN